MNYEPSTRPVARVTDLALPEHDEFRTGKFLEPHRPSGVKLLRADADLRPQPEFPPVGKPGRGVDEHHPGIHLAQEALRAPMCATASSKESTTLIDRIRSRYSVSQSVSVASPIWGRTARVRGQPLSSTPAAARRGATF